MGNRIAAGFLCGLLALLILVGCSSRRAGGMHNERLLHEGLRLYVLAMDESKRNLDGAIALLGSADAAIADVGGVGALPQMAGELAAHIRYASFVFGERHRELARLCNRAATLLRNRPAEALSMIERVPQCDASVAEVGTTPLVRPGAACWPTDDPHLVAVDELRRSARRGGLVVGRRPATERRHGLVVRSPRPATQWLRSRPSRPERDPVTGC